MTICLHVFNTVLHLFHLVFASFSRYKAERVVGHVDDDRVGLGQVPVLQSKMVE